MTRTRWRLGAALGAITSLAVIGLFRLGARLASLPDLPIGLFDWQARVLPGGLITFVIDTLVTVIRALHLGPTSSVAKLAEQLIALAEFILAGAIGGAVLGWLASRLQTPEGRSLARLGAALALLPALAALLIVARLGFPDPGAFASGVWLLIVLAGWGALLGWLLAEAPAPPPAAPEAGLSRRSFLGVIGGGSVAVLLTGLGLDALLRNRAPVPAGSAAADPAGTPIPIDTASTSGPAASPPADILAARLDPAPGTRAEITPNGRFYRIDINVLPPEIDESDWRLELGGLVNQPLSLTLEELRARPAVSQVVTMQCISNPVGGDLTGTSLWTGVRVKDLLDEAGLAPGAQELAIHSADGFYESVPMEDLLDERTLLVYGMNGAPLPALHGFPLRIYIPNRYGMKQPKWITRLEVIGEVGPGYWVDRGWSATAIVQTTSVIDSASQDLQPDAAGAVALGGIAWAGARGIAKVEVQIDEGEWVEALLRTPPLSPLAWVQWRYDWTGTPGQHHVRVRAVDGNGELQTATVAGAEPSGATGYHERTLEV